LITLTGQPELNLILWQWESGKALAKEKIGMRGSITDSLIPYQISYNPGDYSGSSILVTGPSTFVYLKVKTNEEKEQKEIMFETVHSQINNMDEGRQLSDQYTCHAWDKHTSDLVVCTEQGEILICGNNGEYKQYFLGSPRPHMIEAILALDNGFVVSTESGLMLLRTDDSDERQLLNTVLPNVQVQI